MKGMPLVSCFAKGEDTPPYTAVSYLFTYLLPSGYPLATLSGTRVTNYPITAALLIGYPGLHCILSFPHSH